MNFPGHLLAAAAVAAGSLAGLPAFGQATPSQPSELTAEEKAQVEAIRRERLKEHDETVQRALEEYRALLRAARTANDRAVAVWKLGDAEKDPKIVAELARRLNDAENVRGESLAALAKYTGDASASQALVQAAAGTRDAGFLSKAIAALGDVGHPQAVPFLARFLNYREKEPAVLAAAVRATANCHDVNGIEPLVKLWEELDKALGGSAKGWAEERLRAMGDAALPEALAKLTGQTFGSSKEGRAWWTRNRATHRLPPRPLPVLCKRHLGPVHLPGKPLPTGTIVHELWSGIEGCWVKDLIQSGRLSTPPDRKTELTSLASPGNLGDHFGARIRGYLHPPDEGTYTFIIEGDDGFALYLSPNEDPEQKEQLVMDLLKTVESKPIALKAGRRYYIEVLHKEKEGGDFVRVSWKTPRGATEVIPGRCLEPFDDSGASSRVPPSVAKVEEPRRPGAEPSTQPPPSPQTSTRSAFYRAVNLNGPGFALDGNRWESSEEAANCLVFGRPSNQPEAPLDPPVEGARALLLGTAFANAGATDIVLARIPPAAYQVFLYVRSDGGPERFRVTLGGRAVERDRSLCPAGRWARLGPWEAGVTDGAIRLAVRGGAVNVCGIEIWKRE